jgi:hypothetical protein
MFVVEWIYVSLLTLSIFVTMDERLCTKRNKPASNVWPNLPFASDPLYLHAYTVRHFIPVCNVWTIKQNRQYAYNVTSRRVSEMIVAVGKQ